MLNNKKIVTTSLLSLGILAGGGFFGGPTALACECFLGSNDVIDGPCAGDYAEEALRNDFRKSLGEFFEKVQLYKDPKKVEEKFIEQLSVFSTREQAIHKGSDDISSGFKGHTISSLIRDLVLADKKISDLEKQKLYDLITKNRIDFSYSHLLIASPNDIEYERSHRDYQRKFSTLLETIALFSEVNPSDYHESLIEQAKYILKDYPNEQNIPGKYGSLFTIAADIQQAKKDNKLTGNNVKIFESETGLNINEIILKNL
ncbi:hypothetical protein F8158_29635 [Bacillus cereus]|uniref:Uncharacterized protein n=1 Tax=Bacillus cereus TaxID=1396 RepID=A0AB34CX97_BACCE|nr:hypothetical protein [Bacillus cereus]KAB2490395.1 hypothetical protein F8158_29635 [Bacillus cereus]